MHAEGTNKGSGRDRSSVSGAGVSAKLGGC